VLACTTPAELTDATPETDEDQVTYGVIFTGGPAVAEPVAVNCCCCGTVIVGFVGVTTIEATEASDPVPDRATVCGLVLALSVIVRVPVRVPRAFGVKVTEIVQPVPAANVLGVNGQFEVCAKFPEVEIEVIVSALLEESLSVTLLTTLVVVGSWAGNVRLLGVTVTGVRPVPLKEETWGEFEAVSLTLTVPVALPETVGVKVTEIVQLACGARVLGGTGQVEVWAKLPVVEMLVMVRGTV